MAALYDRDYSILTDEEMQERDRIDTESIMPGTRFRENCYHKYPKSVRHNMSLFPNNFIDIMDLKQKELLKYQCNQFEKLLQNKNITELDVKRFIQDNSYYHIPTSIFSLYSFGHHEATLFKEFQLGTSYKADYLLAGRASGGWQFVYVEFENPYGQISVNNRYLGNTIRKGFNQIDDWKVFLEANYASVKLEFEKNTRKPLPKEFTCFDSSRMNYVVVAGRRSDFSESVRQQQRRIDKERNIKIIHYDNLLDEARRLIGKQTY